MTPEDLRERAQRQLAEIEARDALPRAGRYHERVLGPWDDFSVPLPPALVRDILEHDPADDAYCDRDPADKELNDTGRTRRSEH